LPEALFPLRCRLREWPVKKRKLTPKTVLKLPDLEQSKSAVLNSLTSRSSQRSYDALRPFSPAEAFLNPLAVEPEFVPANVTGLIDGHQPPPFFALAEPHLVT
jgi:hypothetical protein